MAVVFTITTAQVLQKCFLDTADSTYQGYANRFIGAGLFQEAVEQLLKTSALVTTNYIVHQGIITIIAGEVLAMMAREAGASESFQGAGLTVGKPVPHGDNLKAQGWQMLAPYLRRVESAITPAQTTPTTGDYQAEVFGRSEIQRLNEDADEDD
jgi:hypothetical protein